MILALQNRIHRIRLSSIDADVVNNPCLSADWPWKGLLAMQDAVRGPSFDLLDSDCEDPTCRADL